MRKEFGKDPSLAAASSFYNNVELTDVRAQKGCAVRSYIQSLGFTADEVMVLGDSLNDLSMFTRGEDLADATMAALRQFAPDSVHPREMDDVPTE